MSQAVLIPCFNEAATIGAVVRAFARTLPDAVIHVFDNASTDETIEMARAAGATVHRVSYRGKGNVIRRMFADIDADVYVLVDGDHTYEARSAPEMIRQMQENDLDMVVATRHAVEDDSYRPGHALGNRLLTGATRWIFGDGFTDMLSGYRVVSRRFAKSFPAQSQGFEIETELTIHALELRMACEEIDTNYHARPDGSQSKLSTWRDGIRILRTILRLFAIEKPLRFYGPIAMLTAIAALALGLPLIPTWLETGLVPRFPTAILAAGLATLSGVTFFSALLLENIAVARREFKQLNYLAQPAPGGGKV